MAVTNNDAVARIIMPLDIGLRQPGALKELGFNGSAEVDTGGGNNIATPGIVRGVMQIARFADITKAGHSAQPMHPVTLAARERH